MGAKACVIFGSDNKPISGALCSLTTNSHGIDVLPLTNQDGYALSQFAYSQSRGYLVVQANGYANYVQPVQLDDANQEIHVNEPGGEGNTIHLPPMVKASGFKKPSRDQIINVRANLCNLTDSDGLPIFEPFIDWLIVNDTRKANEWFSILRDAGGTHINITLTGDYNENLGWIERYPVPGMDWTNDLPGFSNIIKTVLNNGFIPIVKLGFDGQRYDPVGWTYGWSWGMDNLPRISNGLSDWIEYCLWSTGFDGCFADWSPIQLIQMLRHMRNVLGDKAQIDTETNGPGTVSYIHLGQGAANWIPSELGILDHFSLELEVNPIPPSDSLIEGVKEVAERLLDENSKVYYRNAVEKTQAIDYYETGVYWYIRKQLTTSQMREASDLGKANGFTVFGSGLPNS